MRAYLIVKPDLIVRPDLAASLDAAFASGADALVLDFAGIPPGPRHPVEARVPSPVRERDRVRVQTFPERAHPSPQPSPARERGPVAPTETPSVTKSIDTRVRMPSPGGGGPCLIAPVGAVDGPDIDEALSAAMTVGPDVIAFPVAHGRDVAHLGALLAVHEAENGRTDGATRIVALVASAAGALNAASLVDASPRLAGIGWDAQAVADELQAEGLAEAGSWSGPLAQVRSLVRLAAAAAGVAAIEAAHPGDGRGFADHLAAARRDGFDAMLATSPAQIPFIRGA